MSLSSSSSSVSASSSADADDVAIVDPPAADHLVVLYARGLLPLPSDQDLRGDLPCTPGGGIQTHLFLPEDAAVWAAMSVTDLQKMMQDMTPQGVEGIEVLVRLPREPGLKTSARRGPSS